MIGDTSAFEQRCLAHETAQLAAHDAWWFDQLGVPQMCLRLLRASSVFELFDSFRKRFRAGSVSGKLLIARLIRSSKCLKRTNGRSVDHCDYFLFARQPPNEQLCGDLKNNLSSFMRSTGEHLMSGAHIIQR